MRTIILLACIAVVILACRISATPSPAQDMTTGLKNLRAYMIKSAFVNSSKTKLKLTVRMDNNSNDNSYFYDIKLTIIGEGADRKENCRTSKSIKVLKPGEKIIVDLYLQGPSMIHSYKYGFVAVSKTGSKQNS